MRLPEPGKCCCCFSLRNGCIAIAYLQMVSYGLNFFALGLKACGLPLTVDQPEPPPTSVRAVNGLLSLVCLFQFIVSSLCLYGIFKKEAGYVRMFYQSLIPFTILVIIVELCDPGFQSWVGALAMIIGSGTNLYFIICIRSYYFRMLEDKEADMYDE